MNKSLNTEALIWKRILETTDLQELEMLLRLVLTDEESIQLILNKVKNYHSSDVEINLTITGCNNKISS